VKETQVALQLYTIRNLLKTPEDFKKTLPEVRRIGYQAVQTGLGQMETKELKKIVECSGLRVIATHIPMERILGETDSVIEEHKILGAEYVVCPGLPEELHNADGYRKIAGELSRAGEVLARNGLTLGYHNHAIEFERYDGKTGLEILYSESDPRYLKVELDTYWAAYGGADPAAWCLKYAGRLPLVHVKDLGMKKNKPVFMEVGEGNLNWEAIIPACRKSGVKWYTVEQDICLRHPLESAKISLENLRKMGIE